MTNLIKIMRCCKLVFNYHYNWTFVIENTFTLLTYTEQAGEHGRVRGPSPFGIEQLPECQSAPTDAAGGRRGGGRNWTNPVCIVFCFVETKIMTAFTKLKYCRQWDGKFVKKNPSFLNKVWTFATHTRLHVQAHEQASAGRVVDVRSKCRLNGLPHINSSAFSAYMQNIQGPL
jgi:hypothetical protein